MDDDYGSDAPDLRRVLSEKLASEAMTQTEAAAALGVSQSRISRWLAGQPPSYERVPILARFLGMTDDEVLRLIYGATRRPANRRTAAQRLDRVEEQLVELTTRLDRVLDALEARGLAAPPTSPPRGRGGSDRPRRRSA